MGEIELKNVRYHGDLPDTTYDNPAFKEVDLNENASKPTANGGDAYPAAVSLEVPEGRTSYDPNVQNTVGGEDDDDDEDEESDFEDIDPPDNKGLKQIKDAQDSISHFFSTNSTTLWIIVGVVLVLLYFAYFIYAMIYSFGDEGSVRLLWVTCVVVFCFIIYLIKRFAGDGIRECMGSCWSKVEPHGMKINWIVLAILYLFIIIFVIVDVVIVSKKPYNLVSLSGIFCYVILFFIFSYSPAHVNWRAVLWGLALQFIFAIIILRTAWGFSVFNWIGARVDEFLTHTDAGSKFVFGDTTYTMHFFAFKVLPVVIFFSTAISVLFYLGWMQVVIKKVAWVMQVCMGTTAAESLNAAGNIFIGQSEAPLMIRPMINDMTRSELHAVMTGGFATIAGSVLAAYISFGVPANHLISASVMSAPAALAMSKLFYPETQKSKTTVDDVQQMEPSPDRNIIEAASSGASNSISLVANIAANLIAFLAALHFVNATLTWFGHRVGLMPPHHEDLTLEFICSYLLYPFALVMGVELGLDCRKVAKLIGIKTFLNEFVAYDFLGQMTQNGVWLENHAAQNMSYDFYRDGVHLYGGAGMVNDTVGQYPKADQVVYSADGQDAFLVDGILSIRSRVISTYALCGFANFGSMGVQLGALGAMAPRRKRDLSRVVFRAMIAGNVACFMTAAIAGLFYQGEL